MGAEVASDDWTGVDVPTPKQRDHGRRARRRDVWPTVATLIIAAVGAGCATRPAPPLPLAFVDVPRIYGGWYIVATIPNGFEKGMVAPYDVYSSRPDGDIREDFYMQRGSFAAPRKHFTVHDKVLANTGGAEWRVQPFWPISLPFLVLYVDPAYRYVLFGERDRNLGWIYARDPKMSSEDYASLLARFKALGYDPSRFRRLIQSPDEIGAPGFWSDGVKR